MAKKVIKKTSLDSVDLANDFRFIRVSEIDPECITQKCKRDKEYAENIKKISGVNEAFLGPDSINIASGYYAVSTDATNLSRIAVALEALVDKVEVLAMIASCDHKPNHIYRPCSNCGIKIIRPEIAQGNNGK
jgi:hypothetical protein